MYHVLIIQRCSTIDEALFYFKRIITEGLSRSALENYLRADLYHTAGAAETNFDFTETALEKAILSHIRDFLMELGRGVAFVARQQHIVTDTQDYYIDLVFYNIELRSI